MPRSTGSKRRESSTAVGRVVAPDTDFTEIGTQRATIDVRLSYRIIELFSEGLYQSPNKAIEELVANSFDAGAKRVQVLLSSNLQKQDATITVIDDGVGMDARGLKLHWLIGISNKRSLKRLPLGRQQIGKFGIGKLATYVLANRLTHITKSHGRYYSTSMNFSVIDKRTAVGVEPRSPIRIALRELKELEARQALSTWLDDRAVDASGFELFGARAPTSWTVAVMSQLKPKVHQIRPGFLRWALRTALPLRPDFKVWLGSELLIPSKASKGLIKKWVLGKDLVDLPKPSPKGIVAIEDPSVAATDETRFGIDVLGLGRVTGYAEAYKDLLTGKSDEIGRSYGFFVYVFGRLINELDSHFGIPADELRHGTFGRFRAVVHIDALDAELRSNREAVSEGQLLNTAQDLLRSIFNFARPRIERYDRSEEPGSRLARKVAASPSSLSRSPIVDLAREVLKGRATSRYLYIPETKSQTERDALIANLEKRASERDQFISGLTIDFSGSSSDGLARFDVATSSIRINAWHPFVATFHEEFASKTAGQPLELIAMAEILAEAHLYAIGVPHEKVSEFLSLRDQLLRNLANESGRQSAFGVSISLLEARNSPSGLEDRLCAAFTSLGFETVPIGGSGKPDGVATALVAADEKGNARQYGVSLDAKSKKTDKGKVAAGTISVSRIARHRDKYNCQHAIVVGRDFPAKASSAVATEIDDDRRKSAAAGHPKTITLMTIDDLARLVRLRPVKQVGLIKMQELFLNCGLPDESASWVDRIAQTKVKRPPYRKIVETIEHLQRKFKKSSVRYAALRVELSHAEPPIEYENDGDLIELCNAMAQMAPGAIFATQETVELDQSAQNAIGAIDAATKDIDDEDRVPRSRGSHK